LHSPGNLFDDWRVIEEYRQAWGASGEYDVENYTLWKAYYYGGYMDEVVAVAQDTNTMPDGTLDAVFYFLRDAQYNVTALADAAGAVVERYEYGAFGAPTILNAAGATIESSGYGNALLFTGREWDAETGLYYYRMRYYDPALGRFISPEPYGDW